MDSFSSEARPTDVVALLDGFDPCLFDWVSCSGMEVCNQVWDGLWNVPSCCACCVLIVMLYDGCFMDLGMGTDCCTLYAFTVLLDF